MKSPDVDEEANRLALIACQVHGGKTVSVTVREEIRLALTAERSVLAEKEQSLKNCENHLSYCKNNHEDEINVTTHQRNILREKVLAQAQVIVKLREALELAIPHIQFLIARNPQHEEPHKTLNSITEALAITAESEGKEKEKV